MLPNSSEARLGSQHANPRLSPSAILSVLHVRPPSADQPWNSALPISSLETTVIWRGLTWLMAIVVSDWFPRSRLMLTFAGTARARGWAAPAEAVPIPASNARAIRATEVRGSDRPGGTRPPLLGVTGMVHGATPAGTGECAWLVATRRAATSSASGSRG